MLRHAHDMITRAAERLKLDDEAVSELLKLDHEHVATIPTSFGNFTAKSGCQRYSSRWHQPRHRWPNRPPGRSLPAHG